ERDLVGNAARLERLFLGHLQRLAAHPAATASRGVGLIGALELRPRDVTGAAGSRAQEILQEEGAICRAIGDALCFCPPLIITAEQIDELFAAVGRSLDRLSAEA